MHIPTATPHHGHHLHQPSSAPPSQGGRLPWAIPKAVDDIIGLLPYAFLLLVVPSAWASGLVDGSALPVFAFLIAAAFALYSPVLEPQLRPKYDALQKVRAPTAQAPAAPRRSAAHPPPPHAPHTPRVSPPFVPLPACAAGG